MAPDVLSDIPADRAVVDRHRPGVVTDAPADPGRIPADSAVIDGQRPKVVDPPAVGGMAMKATVATVLRGPCFLPSTDLRPLTTASKRRNGRS
jgi:hypothetical protein